MTCRSRSALVHRAVRLPAGGRLGPQGPPATRVAETAAGPLPTHENAASCHPLYAAIAHHDPPRTGRRVRSPREERTHVWLIAHLYLRAVHNRPFRRLLDARDGSTLRRMRIASFNVENLFARPKAMDSQEADAATRRQILGAHARISELFDLPSYAGHEAEILDLLETLGVLNADEGTFVRLRKLRGSLLRRPMSGPVTLVATGRATWVGWVELKTVAVNVRATENTARVIKELGAHVLTVVEADDRPGLDMFSVTMLPAVGGTAYPQVMVVEGNDTRGIDVGCMAAAGYDLVQLRTHIFDTDSRGAVFSRDCCEYHFQTPGQNRLVVLGNHFKSKGYSSPRRPNRGQATHTPGQARRRDLPGFAHRGHRVHRHHRRPQRRPHQ